MTIVICVQSLKINNFEMLVYAIHEAVGNGEERLSAGKSTASLQSSGREVNGTK
jgi:hypothetical protein